MKVEMNWNGEDLDISLSKEEAETLVSFLGYFNRFKDHNVTDEEYDVAEKLYSEINSYIEDDRPIEAHRLVVDELLKLYKTRN